MWGNDRGIWGHHGAEGRVGHMGGARGPLTALFCLILSRPAAAPSAGACG